MLAKLKIHLIFPLGLLLLSLLMALLFANELNAWHHHANLALGFSPMTILLFIALLLPLAPALLLNQTRIVLQILLLGMIFTISGGYISGLKFSEIYLLVPVMACQTMVLTYLRERGLFNRFGLIRLCIIILPLVLLLGFDSTLNALYGDLISQFKFLATSFSFVDLPVWSILFVFLMIYIMWHLRGTEYPLIASSFGGSILGAWLGLEAKSAIWSGLDPVMARTIGFSVSGILMLWCTYLLSWGRAYLDELTGLPGRRGLEEHLAKLSGNYSLVMVDIDHFKKFNDKYGHDVGDDVLRLIGQILQDDSPGIAYRYGGEEFTIVCDSRTAKDLKDELDELRTIIAKRKLTLRQRKTARKKKTQKVSVSASFGVADKTTKRRSPTEVLKAADRALYKAKKAGRNRVWVM